MIAFASTYRVELKEKRGTLCPTGYHRNYFSLPESKEEREIAAWPCIGVEKGMLPQKAAQVGTRQLDNLCEVKLEYPAGRRKRRKKKEAKKKTESGNPAGCGVQDGWGLWGVWLLYVGGRPGTGFTLKDHDSQSADPDDMLFVSHKPRGKQPVTNTTTYMIHTYLPT